MDFSGVQYKRREFRGQKGKDKVGPILVISALGFVASILLFAVMNVVVGLDPLNYVTREFLPQSDNSSTTWQYLCVFLLRMILYVACFMEVARWATFVLIWMVIVNFLAAAIARILCQVCSHKRFRLFTEFRLLIVASSDVLKMINCMNTCSSYFIIVFLLWFIISLWGIVPKMILIGAGVSVALLIQYSLLVFAKTGELGVESGNLVCAQLNRHYCTSNVTKSEKLLSYKMWRAQRPVELWCGSFFVVNKATTSSFMDQVIDKLISAVLLIEPTMLSS